MIPMHTRRHSHARRATVAGQRRLLLRLHRENAAKDREIQRLRTVLSGHPNQLRRMLAASPDAAKRAWIALHERCEELTRANHARTCSACGDDAGSEQPAKEEAS